MSETISALAKAHAVLDLLRRTGPLSPSQLADGVGIPRSSAYRLVDGLRAIDLVVSRADGSIDLSQRWLRLADAARAARTEWGSARHVLEALAQRTGLTAYLAVPRSGTALCLDWARGRGIELLILRPGGSLPLNAGAAPRALRAHLPAADRGSVVACTPFTLTHPDALEADAAAIRRAGFVMADEDVTIGISSLAVPVFDGRSRIRAALSVGGLSRDVHAVADSALDLLRAATRSLGAA